MNDNIIRFEEATLTGFIRQAQDFMKKQALKEKLVRIDRYRVKGCGMDQVINDNQPDDYEPQPAA